MPAVIFSGTAVKALNDQLEFPSGTKVITGDTDDPTSVAKTAPANSFYFREGTAEVYIKQDSGSSTNWNLIPSGTFANVTLSNLGTTAINAHLTPDTTNAYLLGDTTHFWQIAYSNDFRGPQIRATDAIGSTLNHLEMTGIPKSAPDAVSYETSLRTIRSSDKLGIWTVNSAASAGLSIQTGNGTAGNSGDMIFKIGTATGTRGSIFNIDGTEGTDGHVRTQSGTGGKAIWALAPALVTGVNKILNHGLAYSVATSALTIDLTQADGSTDPSTGTAAVKVTFDKLDGSTFERSITAAKGETIPSTALMGHADAFESPVYTYLISDNSTFDDLAFSSTLMDETIVHTTVALNTSSDSGGVLYSASVRTGAFIRLIGSFQSTQTTAGTWASTTGDKTVNPDFIRDSFPQRAFAYDEKTVNTAGGASVATLTVRDLTNLEGDGFTTLASDALKLPPGRYFCRAECPIYRSGTFRSDLRNKTDTAILIDSTTDNAPVSATDSDSVFNRIQGEFTITAVKEVDLRTIVTTARVTDGFGFPANLTKAERYSTIEIVRIGD